MKFKRRDELEDEIEELKLKISEHDRLHGELNDILHPNGDKPSNPSLCDLVAYVQKDLKELRTKLAECEKEDKDLFKDVDKFAETLRIKEKELDELLEEYKNKNSSIDKLTKEVEYWKKSFNKQVQSSRGGHQPVRQHDGKPKPPPKEE